ncbi:MAG: redoxin family protein [Acidobacteria bacterium]|nr:redoxin family protein [Acidobacteriota bacterium]NIM64145.1 redoxin family protein [Acidobacteriota bacterium]NIO59424.1 redoxin family protein [Acidobacteriota bacterium]NIQ30459.1 redoxin family protein [Acidobacteriota bacterium]NIQ85390.1 redoxin family protein [Acidobacteriota bacterium]
MKSHRVIHGILFVTVVFAAAGIAAEADRDSLIRLEGPDGKRIAPLAANPDVRATVVVFVRVDCPISNRYAPELMRIHDAFVERGVAFWLIYPDPAATDDAIRSHLEEYGYPIRALKDPEHAFVERAGAEITPEAAVFDARGRLVYRGRIDDRYVAFGKSRPQPTRRDLVLALEAVLEGRAIENDRTKAVGCFLGDLR